MSSGYKLNMYIALLSIKLMSFFLINVKYPHNNQLKDIEKPYLSLRCYRCLGNTKQSETQNLNRIYALPCYLGLPYRLFEEKVLYKIFIA